MRAYRESHPWITFEATDLNKLLPRTWMLLGEARSKCAHLAGAPLQPEVAQDLYRVALIKGAQATTAIEGNTLTEEQVKGILDRTFEAPSSRVYQQREVRNVLDLLNEIQQQVMSGDSPAITRDLILDFNRRLLAGTEHEPDATPGRVRDHEVVVGKYRGAPAEDCDHLLKRLAEWLESDTFKSDDPEIGFALSVAGAIYAHLYMAWLHPFGDGNGRTARLMEFLIIAKSGTTPVLAAHLMSNHYNLTRDRYYRELQSASRTQDTAGFVAYAIQGFVDGLREQIDKVLLQQLELTWISHVHKVMGTYPSSPACDRQRALVLAIAPGAEHSKGELQRLTPELAALYATKGPRTLSRDLNRLEKAGLMHQNLKRWRANHSLVKAFLPPVAEENP
ncbi:MAG: Fic family protein [Acidimicrobiaceae bacterium]|nr:Fic family protein [Acidimicrobiaceae bacterium]